MERLKRYNLMESLLDCRMSEGSCVTTHVLKFMNYVKQLEDLKYPLNNMFLEDLLLFSLPPSYSQFIMIYLMNDKDKSLGELCGMLRTFEWCMKNNVSHVLPVQERGKKIKKGKGKRKMNKMNNGGKGKAKLVTSSIRKTQVPCDECLYCKNKGHWKRSCPNFLEDLKIGKI